MKYKHDFPFGATLTHEGKTRFRIWAPSTPQLDIVIAGTRRTMTHEGQGWHSLVLDAPAGTRYQYVMPDGMHFPDPAARFLDGDVHGKAVVVDPCDYEWQNTDWAGIPFHETILYELHAGVMGGFRGIRDHLPELQRLGITAIELMPVSEFPGRHNWGYDGVLHFAPDSSYGRPEDLKAMIDAAHGLGIAVYLDVVYNHFGPDGAYIHAFAKRFFTEDVHTPWGAAIDFNRVEVREFFLENAAYWLLEYRFDGLRFDAVDHIPRDFLLELARITRGRIEPGRRIGLVVEHYANAASMLGGPPRFDAQWTDDFHHPMHILLTGETDGYYAPFTDALPLLRRVLAEGFAFQGEIPSDRDEPRGEPSGHLPTSAFVVFLQNHDQIGNRALGERLTKLTDRASLRAAQALLLLVPMIPLLFMGEEFASESPFLFFTDHHDELADLVRKGRRKEFAEFTGFGENAGAEIPDPNAPSTFAASTPAPTDPGHADWLRQLIALRKRHVTPGIPGARSAGADIIGPSAVRAGWTLGTGARLTLAINLGGAAVETGPIDGTPLHVEGRWEGGLLDAASFVAVIAT